MKDDFNAIGILFFFVLGLSLFSCIEEIETSSNPLLGKWVSPYSDNTYWDFLSEKSVNNYRNGKERPGNVEIMTNRGGQEYISTIFGPLHYRYRLSSDTTKFETYGSLNNKTWMKYAAMREDNILYIWNYKTLPGLENHIDEVSYYCLSGNICPSKTDRKVTVIVESGLEGNVHIAFGQKDGTPCQFDKDGNPIIRVDQGSIHKTTLPWHPAFMTHNAFDFLVEDCADGSLLDINDWGHDAYRKKATGMSQTDTVTFGSEDYSLSAFSFGYNQFGRTDLDYEFREYISGQVASFTIGYLADQFVYKEYMKSVKSMGDAIKG